MLLVSLYLLRIKQFLILTHINDDQDEINIVLQSKNASLKAYLAFYNMLLSICNVDCCLHFFSSLQMYIHLKFRLNWPP
jgi:hypothetical protein